MAKEYRGRFFCGVLAVACFEAGIAVMQSYPGPVLNTLPILAELLILACGGGLIVAAAGFLIGGLVSWNIDGTASGEVHSR